MLYHCTKQNHAFCVQDSHQTQPREENLTKQEDDFSFNRLISIVAKILPSSEVIRAWIEADVPPSPSEPLAQRLFHTMGDIYLHFDPSDPSARGHFTRKESINYLLILSHGRTVDLKDGYDPVQFWTELYTAWYERTSPHTKHPLGPLLFEVVYLQRPDRIYGEIHEVGRKCRYPEGVRAFLKRHGFDLELVPDLEPDSPCYSHEVWALIYHKAVATGGRVLWERMLDAVRFEQREMEHLEENYDTFDKAMHLLTQAGISTGFCESDFIDCSAKELWWDIKNSILRGGGNTLWQQIVDAAGKS